MDAQIAARMITVRSRPCRVNAGDMAGLCPQSPLSWLPIRRLVHTHPRRHADTAQCADSLRYAMAAEAWLHKERQLIDHGTWTPPAERVKAVARSSIKLGDFAQDALAGRRLEPTTRSNYRRLLETRIIPGLGDRPVRDITADDLQDWWRDLGAEYESNRAHAWNLLRSLLEEAVEPRSSRATRPTAHGSSVMANVLRVVR